jgi:hypothetical protein
MKSPIDFNSSFGKAFCIEAPWNPYYGKELNLSSYLRHIFDPDSNGPSRRNYDWESVAPGILFIILMIIQCLLIKKLLIKRQNLKEYFMDKPSYCIITILMIDSMELCLVFSLIT